MMFLLLSLCCSEVGLGTLLEVRLDIGICHDPIGDFLHFGMILADVVAEDVGQVAVQTRIQYIGVRHLCDKEAKNEVLLIFLKINKR